MYFLYTNTKITGTGCVDKQICNSYYDYDYYYYYYRFLYIYLSMHSIRFFVCCFYLFVGRFCGLLFVCVCGFFLFSFEGWGGGCGGQLIRIGNTFYEKIF